MRSALILIDLNPEVGTLPTMHTSNIGTAIRDHHQMCSVVAWTTH